MNYFAHAHLAASLRDDPWFVLGAMLPDWQGWIGDRLGEVRHPGVEAGVHFHHVTDAAFHAGTTFNGLMREASEHLRVAGLPRGPSRGAAHVGVELLLDGVLLEDAAACRAYRGALGVAESASAHLGWRREGSRARYDEVTRRLNAEVLPDRYCDPRRVADAIVRVLQHRPRLRVAPEHRPAVVDWTRSAQRDVARAAPDLFAELDAALASNPAARR